MNFEILESNKTNFSLDTYESAMNYFNKFYNNNEHTGAFDLDDDDIDRQAILDGSDDDDDDDVEFLSAHKCHNQKRQHKKNK